MCKIWKIVYTCEHVLKLKKSICRGTIKNTKVVKLDEHGRPRPSSSACLQIADMYFLQPQECGPCTLQHLEERLDDEIHTIRLRIAPHSSPEVRSEAKRQIDEIEKRKIEARMTIPKMNWKAPEPIVYAGRKPGQKSRSKERRTGTLLKREVRPEDVCGDEMYEVVKNDLEIMSKGWDDKDWGSEYKKLGEELVEDREAVAGTGVGSDEDLEVGCDSDTSEDDDGDGDEITWYEDVDDTDELDTATTTSTVESSTTLASSKTDADQPAPSENTYTTQRAIPSMIPSHIRLNAPRGTVAPQAETCNPAIRGQFADRLRQQIAATSASNVDKEDGVRFRFGGEETKKRSDGGQKKKTTMTEGGLRVMAMQVVTL